MDLGYSADERAFRDEVRTWLREHLSATARDKVVRYAHLDREDLLDWHRTLAVKGWIAPAWPPEWGGTGWSVVQRYIFEEECGYAGAPPLIPFGLTMCASVLLKFGTPAQKQRFLPRIYNGDDFWCQGYSEPGAGSDLASLKTKATRRVPISPRCAHPPRGVATTTSSTGRSCGRRWRTSPTGSSASCARMRRHNRGRRVSRSC